MLMALLTWVVYRMNPGKINRIFGKLQILSAGFMALSHGHNDAQKSMGIIALALVLAFPGQDFHVPLMGHHHLRDRHGPRHHVRRLAHYPHARLQNDQAAARSRLRGRNNRILIIAGASHWGIPVSTTQVISSSILGVGATRRLSAVRWGIVGNIIWAWVLTIPLTFHLCGYFYAGREGSVPRNRIITINARGYVER
jgi:PiT family inorganic phosphate transporter